MTPTGGRESWEGVRFEGLDTATRAQAVRAAFEYRGDVTLLLTDGSHVDGYLFACDLDGADAHVRLLPPDQDSTERLVPLAEIAAIDFTGADKASGRSWEAWVRRWKEKQRLLADGVDPGDIEPQPESLD